MLSNSQLPVQFYTVAKILDFPHRFGTKSRGESLGLRLVKSCLLTETKMAAAIATIAVRLFHT